MLSELLKYTLKGAPVDFEIKDDSSVLQMGQVVEDCAQLCTIFHFEEG